MHPDVATLLQGAYDQRAKKQAAPARAAKGVEKDARARYDCVFEEDEGGGAADASALALGERRRRGSALVLCFWEKTFAWVADEDALLPFRGGFPHLASIQSRVQFGGTTPVDAALRKVARRVDAVLSFDCFVRDGVVKKQLIDKAGVRRGAHGPVVDTAFTRDTLRSEAFVGYLCALAVVPLGGADRVDLTIATAQLRAFTRWRGARGLPVYTSYWGIDDGARDDHQDGEAHEPGGATDVVVTAGEPQSWTRHA